MRSSSSVSLRRAPSRIAPALGACRRGRCRAPATRPTVPDRYRPPRARGGRPRTRPLASARPRAQITQAARVARQAASGRDRPGRRLLPEGVKGHPPLRGRCRKSGHETVRMQQIGGECPSHPRVESNSRGADNAQSGKPHTTQGCHNPLPPSCTFRQVGHWDDQAITGRVRGCQR